MENNQEIIRLENVSKTFDLRYHKTLRAVDDVFYHRLGGVHVVVEVCKRHLGLYHPELGGVGDLL